jgi:hypothetical protein
LPRGVRTRAYRAGGRPLEADGLEPRVHASLAELTQAGRLADASLLQASMFRGPR